MEPDTTPSATAATLNVRPDSIGLLMRQALLSMTRLIDRDMAALDLTAMQWRPLVFLAVGRADTPAELARLADVDTGAMTRTLDRLEAKGLLRRMPCVEDRRKIRLALTPTGQAAAAQCPAVFTRILDHHLQGFSTEETEQLRSFMQRMVANSALPLAAASFTTPPSG